MKKKKDAATLETTTQKKFDSLFISVGASQSASLDSSGCSLDTRQVVPQLFAYGLAATMRSSRRMEMKMESYNNHFANFSRKKGTMTQSNVKGRGKEETFLGPPGRSAPSPPRWMKTERTDMRRRFEAASAKNVETMASDEDKHVFVLVHGLGGSEDDLLALATELLDRDTNNVILRVTCNCPMRSFDGIVAGGSIVGEVGVRRRRRQKGPLKRLVLSGVWWIILSIRVDGCTRKTKTIMRWKCIRL